MNIEKAIKLINKKKTTIEDVYTFVFKDVESFQSEREAFYLQELKEQCAVNGVEVTESYTEGAAEKISAKIERDTKFFVGEYVDRSTDALLDAFNDKKIKHPNGVKNFIILLTQLKENYINDNIEP